MAAKGAIYAEDGSLLVDIFSVCMAYRSKGTVTAGTYYGERARLISIDVIGEMPILVLDVVGRTAPLRRGATVLQTTRSGSTWTFLVLIYDDVFPGNFTFTYRVYDAPVLTPGPGSRAWDASGRLLFDWNNPIMNVRAGGSPGFVASSKMSYQESANWNSEEMRDEITYSYTCELYWTNGAGVVGDSVVVANGRDWQPPNLGYEFAGINQGVLIVDIAGQ